MFHEYVSGSFNPAGSVADAVNVIELPSFADVGPLIIRFCGATLFTVTASPSVM